MLSQEKKVVKFKANGEVSNNLGLGFVKNLEFTGD